MKQTFLSLSVLLSSLCIGSQVHAGHVPAIEVKIDGNAARYVKPELVFNDNGTSIEMFKYEDVFMAEDVGPGSYTLTLVDKDKGTVLLVEPMTLIAKGSHHVSGNTRHLDCSFKSGAIVCLNYY